MAGLIGERPIQRWLGDPSETFHSETFHSGHTAATVELAAPLGTNGRRLAQPPTSQPSVQRSIWRPDGQHTVAGAGRSTAYSPAPAGPASVVQRLRFAADGTATLAPQHNAVTLPPSGFGAPAEPSTPSAPSAPSAPQQANEVSVQLDAVDTAAAAAPPTVPAADVGVPPPGGPPAGAQAGSTSPTDVDALVRRLYDPMMRRLKAELRLDRERAGHALDLRH
jgi:hypothetical protein